MFLRAMMSLMSLMTLVYKVDPDLVGFKLHRRRIIILRDSCSHLLLHAGDNAPFDGVRSPFTAKPLFVL